MSDYEVFRVCTDMEALHEAFRDRVEDLNISRETVDAAGGFTARYSAKLLCEPPMKWVGRKTLPKMLKAIGLAIILVVDDERFQPLKEQLEERKRVLHPNRRTERPKWLLTTETAIALNVKRWANVPKEKRTRLARKAAKARHRKRRKQVANSQEMQCVVD